MIEAILSFIISAFAIVVVCACCFGAVFLSVEEARKRWSKGGEEADCD